MRPELAACRTLGSDSENSPRRDRFSTISPGNSRTIAQEMGEKWAGADSLQPETPKSDRLLEPACPTQAWQHAFATRVRAPANAPLPLGATPRRMAIYEELLFNNLEGFLLACYPVTRRILGRRTWHRAVRDFYREHPCHSPLFRDIPHAFLDWLTPRAAGRYPSRPWLAEFMHYEWLELEVSLLPEAAAPEAIDVDGDLLAGRPALQPASRIARYRYPVHRISPRFRPQHEEPHDYLLYRVTDAAGDDSVRFLHLNPLTARLFTLLKQGVGSGREAIVQLAEDRASPSIEILLTHGAALLDEARRQGAVLGTWKAAETVNPTARSRRR